LNYLLSREREREKGACHDHNLGIRKKEAKLPILLLRIVVFHPSSPKTPPNTYTNLRLALFICLFLHKKERVFKAIKKWGKRPWPSKSKT